MNVQLRGHWTPSKAPAWFALLVQIIVIEVTLWRGWDYALGDTAELKAQLGAVEQFFEIEIWGYAFVLVGVVMLAGLVLARPSTIITGHVMSGGLYLAIATGVVGKTIPVRGLDGSRTSNELIAFAVLSIAIATWTFLVAVDDEFRERKWREVLGDD